MWESDGSGGSQAGLDDLNDCTIEQKILRVLSSSCGFSPFAFLCPMPIKNLQDEERNI